MKLRYKTGLKPVPMLMYFTEVNEQAFNEMLNSPQIKISKNAFSKDHNHIWNMGSYIIYNDQEVVSVVCEQISHMIWLFRTINKPIVFEVDENQLNLIKEDLKEYFDNEFEIVS